MIRSMTGYASVRSEQPDFSLTVSLKSTNHRFLDLQLRLPSALDSLEPAVRRLMKEKVARGHVEVTVLFERSGAARLQLNRELLEAYAEACLALREQFGSLAPPDPVALLRIPGVVSSTDGNIPDAALDAVRVALEKLLLEALAEHERMRDAEGRALEADLRARLGRLARFAREVGALVARVPELYRRRLETRVKELLGSANDPTAAPAVVDPGRLAQEILYLASRSDVAEELTRLESHLDQVEALFAESTDVGKKLDFLLQEMNREANTLLSKTTDVPEAGAEIARQAIEMKTEIEKLREQAQNIE